MGDEPDGFSEFVDVGGDGVRIATVADEDCGVITAVLDADGSVILTMFG